MTASGANASRRSTRPRSAAAAASHTAPARPKSARIARRLERGADGRRRYRGGDHLSGGCSARLRTIVHRSMKGRAVRTVLITGATSGIGRHTAIHLARRGFQVFATGRNELELRRLAAEAESAFLVPLRLDVTDPASVAAAVKAVDESAIGPRLD